MYREMRMLHFTVYNAECVRTNVISALHMFLCYKVVSIRHEMAVTVLTYYIEACKIKKIELLFYCCIFR